MSVLAELREELQGFLTEGGITAFDHIPARVQPPVAVVAAGSPYILEVFDAKTFNHDYQVRMEVTLIANQATNDIATDTLDDLICDTLIALADHWEAEVSQPFQLEVNNAVYLAATVSISTTVTID